MMQLQDDIDKSNPSNPNPCRFARKMWCGPPDGFRHLCSPIWTSMIQWFTHTEHQLVYFLTLWWIYSSTLPSERILPMLLRTLEKARKNKMGVACFGGCGVTSQETWRLLFKSLSFSKSRIHSVNCLEPDYVHLLSKSTETLASRLLITRDTHLLVAETIPPKPPLGHGHLPPIFRRLRGQDGRCLDLMQCWRRFSTTLLAGHGAVWVCGSDEWQDLPPVWSDFWVGPKKKHWRVMSNYFFHVHPFLGEMIQFDERIFQMGWNHQLVEIDGSLMNDLHFSSTSLRIFGFFTPGKKVNGVFNWPTTLRLASTQSLDLIHWVPGRMQPHSWSVGL